MTNGRSPGPLADLAEWAARRQQRREQGVKTSSRSWRIPAGLVTLGVCFIIWQHYGFVPTLIFAAASGIAVRLDAIIKAINEKGSAPKGWYPSPSGDGERYWNGHEWADLPARPVSR